MNVPTTGAARAKLSLPYGTRQPGGAACERRSPTLTDHELRRIVAGMIG
ncbi:MAG TPA: hypothetical protein VGW34_08195 [Allosphingosinicella sp.]|nr:hypothetical protein [Allosphingosinicella sp.]